MRRRKQNSVSTIITINIVIVSAVSTFNRPRTDVDKSRYCASGKHYYCIHGCQKCNFCETADC